MGDRPDHAAFTDIVPCNYALSKKKTSLSELFKKVLCKVNSRGCTLPFPVKHFLLLLFSFYVTLTPCDTMYHGKYIAATSLWTKTKLGNLKKYFMLVLGVCVILIINTKCQQNSEIGVIMHCTPHSSAEI